MRRRVKTLQAMPETSESVLSQFHCRPFANNVRQAARFHFRRFADLTYAFGSTTSTLGGLSHFTLTLALLRLTPRIRHRRHIVLRLANPHQILIEPIHNVFEALHPMPRFARPR